MTDEEIISIVLDICIYKGDNDGLSKKEYQAIQGLVDLYNKEKEKSQKQDTEINKLNNVIDRMENWIERDCYYQDEFGNSCSIIQDSCFSNKDCKECIKEYFMEDKE